MGSMESSISSVLLNSLQGLQVGLVATDRQPRGLCCVVYQACNFWRSHCLYFKTLGW